MRALPRGGSAALLVIVTLLGLANGAAPAAAGSAPNDPLYRLQWGLHRIEAVDAWRVSDGSGALVAVIDTGVDADHPDLRSNLVRARDCGATAPLNAHGTHVSGIVAATTGNGRGIAGVAPAADILSIRYFGEGACDYAESIRYAARVGADVINLSNGYYGAQGAAYETSGMLEEMKDAIDYALQQGAVVVKSAGNDKSPVCSEPASGLAVICVGAINSLDAPTTYTSHDVAARGRYVVAPGGEIGGCDQSILSLWPTASTPNPVFAAALCEPERGYSGAAGTSMAAPHVAGVAALLAAGGLNSEAIADCIVANTEDLGPTGWDPLYGHGLVNARLAVQGCL